MKTSTCVLSGLASVVLSTTAFAQGPIIRPGSGCDLSFSDDNGNGIGSVEGFCQVNIPYDAGSGSPSFRLVVRGLQDGERRALVSMGSLPITDYSWQRRGFAFWDANRNGEGTVQGIYEFRDVEDWTSRNVSVLAIIDGDVFEIFRGRLRRY